MGGQPPFSFSISTTSLSNGGGATTLTLAKKKERTNMSYSLYIKRATEPVTLKEWVEAVESTDGIRICDSESHTTKNPQTGATIGLRARPGDAEIFDGDTNQWHFAVMWRDGQAEFNARIIANAIDGDLSDPFWIMFLSLATKLGAEISGEEGEIYDTTTVKAK